MGATFAALGRALGSGSELVPHHRPHMLAYGRARLLTRITVPNRHFYIARNHKEDARWPGWELVVGIEVHAQIKSSRKLFSGKHADITRIRTMYLGLLTETLVSGWYEPNAHVSAFDAAFPGTLPVTRLHEVIVVCRLTEVASVVAIEPKMRRTWRPDRHCT